MGSNGPKCHRIWKSIPRGLRFHRMLEFSNYTNHPFGEVTDSFSSFVENKKNFSHPVPSYWSSFTITHMHTWSHSWIFIENKIRDTFKRNDNNSNSDQQRKETKSKKKEKTIFSSFNEKIRNMRMACKTMCTYIEKGTEKRRWKNKIK